MGKRIYFTENSFCQYMDPEVQGCYLRQPSHCFDKKGDISIYLQNSEKKISFRFSKWRT